MIRRLRTHGACAAAASVVLVLGLAQSTWLSRLPARPLPHYLHQPVLALELRCDDAGPEPILRGDAETHAMRVALGIDDALLVSYAALFLLCGVLLWGSRRRLLALGVATLGLGAAGCDGFENRAMRAMLDGRVACPEPWALVKWTLLFAALVLVTAVYLDFRGTAARIALGLLAALASLVAGVEGLLGVARYSPLLIEAASMRLRGALVLGFVYLATYQALHAGLRPCLDRLATRRLVGWLSTWPPDSAPEPTATPPPPGPTPP